jgi:hypothetical protein
MARLERIELRECHTRRPNPTSAHDLFDPLPWILIRAGSAKGKARNAVLRSPSMQVKGSSREVSTQFVSKWLFYKYFFSTEPVQTALVPVGHRRRCGEFTLYFRVFFLTLAPPFVRFRHSPGGQARLGGRISPWEVESPLAAADPRVRGRIWRVRFLALGG